MGFWTTFIIQSVLTIMRVAFKNPAKREELRGVLLNIRDNINALYPEDAATGFFPEPPK